MERGRSRKPFKPFSWESSKILTGKMPVLVAQGDLLAELPAPEAWQARLQC